MGREGEGSWRDPASSGATHPHPATAAPALALEKEARQKVKSQASADGTLEFKIEVASRGDTQDMGGPQPPGRDGGDPGEGGSARRPAPGTPGLAWPTPRSGTFRGALLRSKGRDSCQEAPALLLGSPHFRARRTCSAHTSGEEARSQQSIEAAANRARAPPEDPGLWACAPAYPCAGEVRPVL